KLALADRALSMFPNFPPFHLERGKALATLDRRAQATAALRNGLDFAPDVGTRTWLLVQLAQQTEAGERRALLEEAKALDGDRVAAAMACVLLAEGVSSRAR
ncbi:MAG TPA: hypothetical protein VJ921_09360, partial [Vicinamibacteria bacterium]|nr:hypothetical protein [Vicinamibacteria bacterium]